MKVRLWVAIEIDGDAEEVAYAESLPNLDRVFERFEETFSEQIAFDTDNEWEGDDEGWLMLTTPNGKTVRMITNEGREVLEP